MKQSVNAVKPFSGQKARRNPTILVAEGKKESEILDAEAEKQATFLRAEAEKEKMIRKQKVRRKLS